MPNKINMEMLGKELDTEPGIIENIRTGESNLSVSIQMIIKAKGLGKLSGSRVSKLLPLEHSHTIVTAHFLSCSGKAGVCDRDHGS